MSDDLRHGGALDRLRLRFPSAPEPWLDLSTGINPWPFPAPPLHELGLSHLPRAADADVTRRAMAACWACDRQRIVLTPGTELGIALLPRIRPAGRVAVVSPTYGDHARAWTASGGAVSEVPDLPSAESPFDVVVVVNPNNPDGRRHAPPRLLALADAMAGRGGHLVVDEAYGDTEPALSVAPHAGHPGLIVLRSFGKFFGLPGVRLGAVLGPPSLVGSLGDLLGSWAVSGPALALGTRAYADRSWQAKTRQRLAAEAAALDRVLEQQDRRIVGGTTLFRLVRCPDAHALWHHLARAGIATRRFDWDHTILRVGLPPSSEARARLRQAWHEAGP